MSYLPIALFSYLLNSLSVLIDKFLISKSVPNPFFYVFYISVFSLVTLALLPFSHFPSLEILFFASLSSVLWSIGLYFMFKALKIGQVSRVIPVIGALIPIGLTLFGVITNTLTINEVWAIGLLILGFICLVIPYFKGHFNKEEFIYEVVSALCYISFYLTLREAYMLSDFLTVLVWGKPILVIFILLSLIIPYFRRQLKGGRHEHHPFKFLSLTGLLFLTGQIIGGIAEFLKTYSISLANPALVNSLQGVQYVFLLVLGLILSLYYPNIFKEKFSKKGLLLKFCGIVIVFLGLIVLSVYGQVKASPIIGITFSPREVASYGLSPREIYINVLDDLKVKNIRLPVYWDEVALEDQNTDFSDVDFYISEAEKRGAKIVLVVGYKQPRWPECFTPTWISGIPQEHRKERLLNLVAQEVKYFRRYQNIQYWQVENEPLFHYGDCRSEDHITFDSLKDEVELVRNLDPKRPVLIADSGELSTWLQTMSVSDIFGFTLYREVWNPILGTTTYPFPPFLYSLKDQLVRLLINKEGQSIVIELQAEPWPPNYKSLLDVSVDEQLKLFPKKKLKTNFNFAKETGSSAIYFWGIEWWFYMKQNNHPEYIETFKSIMSDNNF